MMDFNQLFNQFSNGQNADLARLQALLQSPQGQQFVNSVPPVLASRIQQAAEAAANGDKLTAMRMVNEILSTPEGAALAAQILRVIGGK